MKPRDALLSSVLLSSMEGFTLLHPSCLGLPKNVRKSRCCVVSASKRETLEQARVRRGERKGYYIRPASAFERGGGFFIPGLEGWRLRFAISSIILLLLAAERSIVIEGDTQQLLSEAIAATAAISLIIRTALETARKDFQVSSDSPSSADVFHAPERNSYFSRLIEPGVLEDRMWTANAFLDLTSSKAVSALLSLAQSFITAIPDSNFNFRHF